MKKDETLEEKERMMLDHLKQICNIQDSSPLDSTDERWSAETSAAIFILGNSLVRWGLSRNQRTRTCATEHSPHCTETERRAQRIRLQAFILEIIANVFLPQSFSSYDKTAAISCSFWIMFSSFLQYWGIYDNRKNIWKYFSYTIFGCYIDWNPTPTPEVFWKLQFDLVTEA